MITTQLYVSVCEALIVGTRKRVAFQTNVMFGRLMRKAYRKQAHFSWTWLPVWLRPLLWTVRELGEYFQQADCCMGGNPYWRADDWRHDLQVCKQVELACQFSANGLVGVDHKTLEVFKATESWLRKRSA